FTCNKFVAQAAICPAGNISCLGVMKTGFTLFKILWKSYPNLESMQMFFSTSEVLRSSLGMYHSCSGRHPVHRSRLYLHVITQTVFMLYGAFQKIGKRRQSNMGVRCDIKILV